MSGSETLEPTGPAAATETAGIALLAVALTALWHAALGDIGLNLQDEGFLWYGVLRVAEGAVPLRDFQSYDPARYYWCALWTPLFGGGIAGLRAALALFQAAGLCCGLLVARRVVRPVWALVPVGLVLLLWSFPRWKVFEPSIALMAALLATRLVESPSARRHFAAGAFAGLVACFGRNHGAYALASFSLLSLYLGWKRHALGLGRNLALLAAGAALGYVPVLLAMGLVPGFATSSVEFSQSHLRRGSNLPLPYPWPWTTRWVGLSLAKFAGQASLALYFVAPFVIYPVGLVSLLRSRAEQLVPRSVWVGTLFVGACYMHHVSVRSDAPHLAQSLPPLLLSILALPTLLPRLDQPRARALLLAALALTTGLAALAEHPLLRPLALGQKLATHRVGQNELRVEPALARLLTRLEAIVAREVPAGADLFVVPRQPTFYPLLERKSPFYELYTTWDAGESDQREMIETLKRQGVNWGLVNSAAQDGRPELAFPRTHPSFWAHLNDEFERVPTPGLPPAYSLFRRRAQP